MKKHKILDKKRLMKNTTSMISILVVALLVFSSAISALNTSNASENMNIENKDISISDAENNLQITLMATTQATSEASSFFETADFYEYTQSPKTTGRQPEELWNNTWEEYVNLGSSQDDSYLGLFSQGADDFILETAGYIDAIHFIAGYWNPTGDGNFDWRVYFYDDDGTGEKPAEEEFAVYDFPNDVTNEDPLGGFYFDYWCYLEDIGEDPLFLAPETKYWICVQGVGDYPPQSGFAMHTDPIQLNEGVFRSEFFGYPNWVPGSSVFGTPNDHCFAIWGHTSTPEHDVAIKSINKPESGQPAVPENEMQVTIKNWGNNTETFEAQMNIIRCEGSGDFLLSENFSGTFPPDGWTTDYWKQTYTHGATGDAIAEPEASCYYMDQYPNQDCYIMSPPINCSGWEKVNLKFGFGADVYDPSYTCTVYLRYRKNDTSPWTDLTPWENPISEDFQDFFEIGCYGFGEELGDGFQFKFEYIGYYYQYRNFYLDEVTLEGCAGCAEYAEICEEPITLDAGEEIDVDFPVWISTNWQDPESENSVIKYPIQAFTMLEGDENPWNDNKWELVDIYYPWMDDVAPIDLSGPATGPAQAFNVGTTVKNVGQNTECCFKTHVAIAEIDYDNPVELWYEDFIDGNYYVIPGWTPQPPTSPYAWRCYPYYNYLYMVPGTYQPNLQLRWNYANPSACIRSDPIDTSSAGAMDMEWAMYYDHFSGAYEIYVEIRPDPGEPWAQIQPWDNPVTTSIAGDMFTIDATIGIGPETQLQFRTAGNYYNMDYWYHDNIKFLGYDMKEPEHEAEMCIMELEPADTVDIDFGEWIPEFLAEEKTGERNYLVRARTNLEDPPDGNPANDILQYAINLQFFHDVGVKEVTSPSIGRGDVIFSQEPIPPGSGEHGPFSDAGTNYRCYENFWDLTNNIGEVHWWGICGYGAGAPQEGSEFEISFCADNGGIPDYTNHIVDFAGALGTEITYEGTGVYYFGYELFYFTMVLPEFVELAEGWVSFYKTTVNAQVFAMIDAEIGSGDGQAYQAGVGTIGYDLAFELVSGGPSVYVPLGPKDIDVTVENIGTFQELGLTCYATIDEFVTNCTYPTLDYEDNITNIDLDVPLGGTEILNFNDYDFALEGTYELFIEIPLEIPPEYDIDLANNQKKVVIGADGTPPDSLRTLVPATPDGENDWYVSDVEVTLEASDPEIGCGMPGSEVNRIMYKIGTGSWQSVPGDIGTFVIDTDGDDLQIQYYAVDNVGNEESTHSFNIDMDQTLPEIEEVAWESYQDPPLTGPWYVRFTCNATDAMSDMDRVVMYINDGFHEEYVGPGPGYEFIITWSETFKTVDFKWEHYDIAGWHSDDIIPGEDITAYPYPYQQQYPYPYQQQQQQPLGS